MNTWTTVYDTATIDQQPLTVEQASELRVCRICREAAEPRPNDPFIYNGGREHAHESCLKTQPEPTPVAEEETALNFCELRDAFYHTPDLLVHATEWTGANWAAVRRVFRGVPRLIDMAERCETAERKFNERLCQVTALQQLLGVSEAEHKHWYSVADGRLTTIRNLEAERDRLQHEICQLRAERALAQQCEEPCVPWAGLSKEDKSFLAQLRDCVAQRKIIGVPWGQKILDIIDHLLQARGPKVNWHNGGRCCESGKQLFYTLLNGTAYTALSPMPFCDDVWWTTVAELLKAIGPEDSEEGRPDVSQLKTAHLDVLREFSPQKTSLGCIPGASPKHYMQELIEAGVLRWDGFQVDLTDVGKVLVERVTGKQFPQEFGQDIQTRADRAVKSLLKATGPK